MRVTLDTNILIYAAQRGDARHAAAVAVVRRAVRGDCVQTLQSLGECFHVLRRKRLFDVARALQIVRNYQELFRTMVAAELRDLDRALHLSEAHGFQFWDALLWATASRAGCRVILTEDRQGMPDLEGVRFLNPFDPGHHELVDLILPPLEA